MSDLLLNVINLFSAKLGGSVIESVCKRLEGGTTVQMLGTTEIAQITLDFRRIKIILIDTWIVLGFDKNFLGLEIAVDEAMRLHDLEG